jgi:hypothetical protein
MSSAPARVRRAGALVGLVLLEFLAGSARATVDSAGESGFQVKETAHVAAGPDAVYAVLSCRRARGIPSTPIPRTPAICRSMQKQGGAGASHCRMAAQSYT